MAILLIPCVSRSVSKDESSGVFYETLADRRGTVVTAPGVGLAALVGKCAELLLGKVVLASAVLDAMHSQWRL